MSKEKTIGEVLSEIQKTLKAPKGQTNNFGKYKYRNCEDILEGVKKVTPEGVCILLSDEIVNDPLRVEAKATITYKEDKISVTASAGIDINKKGMDISQTFGAASSYARKYALNGLLCIDDTKDADSMDNSKKSPAKKATKKQLEEVERLSFELELDKEKQEASVMWASNKSHTEAKWLSEAQAEKLINFLTEKQK